MLVIREMVLFCHRGLLSSVSLDNMCHLSATGREKSHPWGEADKEEVIYSLSPSALVVFRVESLWIGWAGVWEEATVGPSHWSDSFVCGYVLSPLAQSSERERPSRDDYLHKSDSDECTDMKSLLIIFGCFLQLSSLFIPLS